MKGKKYAQPDYVCDLASIPVEDGRFHHVLLTQVLEHIPDPATVLAELHRVLKPGGTLWLTAPLFYAEHEKPYDFFRYTQFGLRHLLEGAGFTCARSSGWRATSARSATRPACMSRALPASRADYGGGAKGLALALGAKAARRAGGPRRRRPRRARPPLQVRRQGAAEELPGDRDAALTHVAPPHPQNHPTTSGRSVQSATDAPRRAHCVPFNDSSTSFPIVRDWSSQRAAPSRAGIEPRIAERGREHEVEDDRRRRREQHGAEADPVSIGTVIETAAWPIIAAESDHVASPLAPRQCRRDAARRSGMSWNATSASARRAEQLRDEHAARCGTSANVIIAVRCDHSEVTSRIPMTGSRTVAGTQADREEVDERWRRRRAG